MEGAAFTLLLAQDQSVHDTVTACGWSAFSAAVRSDEDSTPNEEEYERELKEMVGCVHARTVLPSV